jgi:hypothetical protein
MERARSRQDARVTMKLVATVLIALVAAICGPPVAADNLRPWGEVSPSGNQKTWHAALDARDLPAETRPATISAVIEPYPADAVEVPRITVAVNGLVIGRAWAKRGRATTVTAKIENRFLSVRNHITVSATALGHGCSGTQCNVAATEIHGGIAYTLADATAGPVQFSEYVTRFRKGIAVKVDDPAQRAWGELAVRALGPLAPRRAAGPAEIVVSRETPAGTSPRLRFDTGPVAIRDREGRLLYDGAALERYAVVQMTSRGDAPVLWIRPGTQAKPPAEIELDNGNIALFGAAGREIAFAPEQDRAVTIAYAADAAREAQTTLYWRLFVAAVWLAATIGLVLVLRRMAPLETQAA